MVLLLWYLTYFLVVKSKVQILPKIQGGLMNPDYLTMIKVGSLFKFKLGWLLLTFFRDKATPSVRNYLSSKWTKMDVSKTKIHLDTSLLSILMKSISGRREYRIMKHQGGLFQHTVTNIGMQAAKQKRLLQDLMTPQSTGFSLFQLTPNTSRDLSFHSIHHP